MTYQVRETLAYRGERRRLRALPLTGCDRPVPRRVGDGVSSGCHRGYEGVWEVQVDALHLIELWPPHAQLWAAHGGPPPHNRLAEMFPDRPGPVEADWFSGEVTADDAVEPSGNGRGFPEWFALVVHRGKVLLEVTTDLTTDRTAARLTAHADRLFPDAEVAFCRAIWASQADPLPKLAFADWLDERSDPRGPLLRSEAERLHAEPPRRPWAEWAGDWVVPTGCVSPDDLTWYWRWLAGVPDATPEDHRYREIRRESRERSGRLNSDRPQVFGRPARLLAEVRSGRSS